MSESIIERAKHIHSRIVDDVYPDGWHGNCHSCGKSFYYTREECGYYLGHGWPKCDHRPNETIAPEGKGEAG